MCGHHHSGIRTMNDAQKILYILNQAIKRKIKDGETEGWTYYKGRSINGCFEMGFRCPAGEGAGDVEKLLPAIQASCGMEVELYDYKGYVMIRLCPNPMPTIIKFKLPMLKGLRPGEILIGYDRIGNRISFYWELPHGIIAGETGMGKTDLIRLIILCLLRDITPTDIRIIDLKQLSFLPFRNIPNVTIGTGITDAMKMLGAAAKEVRKRNNEIEKSGSRSNTKNLQKIVVIIDEAADISPAAFSGDDKAIAKQMENDIATIARLGREVKVHLLYCTQYPTAQVISPQIKINCGMRLGLYVPTFKNSEVVLDRKGAEDLHAIPGRAIFKKNLYTTVQIPYVGGDDVWEKLLQPLKKEVISFESHGENTDKTGNHPERPIQRPHSNQGTDSKVIPFERLPPAKGESTTGSTGEKEVDRMRMAPPPKDLEDDAGGAADDDDDSDKL